MRFTIISLVILSFLFTGDQDSKKTARFAAFEFAYPAEWSMEDIEIDESLGQETIGVNTPNGGFFNIIFFSHSYRFTVEDFSSGYIESIRKNSQADLTPPDTGFVKKSIEFQFLENPASAMQMDFKVKLTTRVVQNRLIFAKQTTDSTTICMMISSPLQNWDDNFDGFNMILNSLRPIAKTK